MIENLEIILSLAGTILGLLITVLTFWVKMINNSKAKKIAEEAIRIGNSVLPYIKEAEKFVSYSGEEKKAYVMTKANQFAIENNIPFNEEKVSEKIEELVELTRQVNTKIEAKEKKEISNQIEQIIASNAEQTA